MGFDPRSLSVYVVTSGDGANGRGHLEIAEAAISGGATAIQLRAPELEEDALAPLAREIAERCRVAGVLFVVNDRADVAAAVGAGAHVGRADDPAAARDTLGPDAVLGMSVATVDEATAAERAGADYVGVTVWATRSKPDARPIGLGGLAEIARATTLPVVGIGGIDPSNAREVLEAGAAGVAVISAVSNAPDPIEATRSLVDAVKSAGVIP
jgi:thiamine-phosphate pyrophosphorylase